MADNYLEKLVAEWHEYRGYFVRKNVHVGKRVKGGYDCELDVVAFHPENSHLVHFETSMDADSWNEREEKYANKFDAGKRYIPRLFKGLKLPQEIGQFILLGYGSNLNHSTLAGARVVTIRELIRDIILNLKDKSIYREAVPEQYPILRTLQFVANNKISLG